MLRDAWKFTYTAASLAQGAQAKCKFHEERIVWWRKRKDELVAQIRADGIEVSEGAALAYSHPKSRDYERGAKVMVRNDLRLQLDECMEKLAHHVSQRRDYDGWVQVLGANPQAQLQADLEDWLFYFSKN